jgi:hypothetical protein
MSSTFYSHLKHHEALTICGGNLAGHVGSVEILRASITLEERTYQLIFVSVIKVFAKFQLERLRVVLHYQERDRIAACTSNESLESDVFYQINANRYLEHLRRQYRTWVECLRDSLWDLQSGGECIQVY